jgi:hypothetical protein
MAAREKCQHEPHQRMVRIRPKQREEHPVHDTIADQSEEDEHNGEPMRITQPAPGSAFLGSNSPQVFSMVLVYDRTIAMGIKQRYHDSASVVARSL